MVAGSPERDRGASETPMWTGRVQLDITRLKPERLANDLVTNDHAPLRRNPGGDDERLSIEEGSRWPLVELGGSDSGCGGGGAGAWS